MLSRLLYLELLIVSVLVIPDELVVRLVDCSPGHQFGQVILLFAARKSSRVYAPVTS